MHTIYTRVLAQDKDKRTPTEQAALTVWLAHRADVFRRALLECEEPPNLDAQIESIDRIMLDVFNDAAALQSNQMHDISYLMAQTIDWLKSREWVPRRYGPPQHMAGSLPTPTMDDGKVRFEFDTLR